MNRRVHQHRPRAGADAGPVRALARAAMRAAASGFVALHGCASQAETASAPTAAAPVAASSAPATGATELREAGLALVRWYTPADPEQLRRALEDAERSGKVRRERSGLVAEGFTLLRMPRSEVRPLLESLGGTNVIRRTWIGQPLAPTTLASAPIARGTVVYSGGRPSNSAEGTLQLRARGWCFPTVEGACARVELMLGLLPARLGTVSLHPAGVRDRLDGYTHARTVLELSPDEVLLLTATPLAPRASDVDDGPTVSVPPTRGALLLADSPFPDRVLSLLIEPSFGDMLPPGASAQESEQEAAPEAQPVAKPDNGPGAEGAREPGSASEPTPEPEPREEERRAAAASAPEAPEDRSTESRKTESGSAPRDKGDFALSAESSPRVDCDDLAPEGRQQPMTSGLDSPASLASHACLEGREGREGRTGRSASGQGTHA